MGKYSNYIRIPRDKYYTPIKAVEPLIAHLPVGFTFCEPCAGDGRLIDHLERLSDGFCVSAYDIEPDREDIEELDSTSITEKDLDNAELIITNPPWTRDKKSDYLLHKFITNFSDLRPTWLLFDADWLHTLQSSDLVASRLCKIVSIGRVKWIEDSSGTGKDNCCWYLFDANKTGPTEFYGR